METLKARFGPLPVWGWLTLVTGLLLAWYLYEQHKNGGAASSSSSTAADQAPEIVVQTGGETSPTQSTTPTPEPATGPPPVSRVDRSPKVDRQIHQIHQEHEASLKGGGAKPKKTTGGAKVRPADATPDKKTTGPARKPISKGAPARHLATSHPVED